MAYHIASPEQVRFINDLLTAVAAERSRPTIVIVSRQSGGKVNLDRDRDGRKKLPSLSTNQAARLIDALKEIRDAMPVIGYTFRHQTYCADGGCLVTALINAELTTYDYLGHARGTGASIEDMLDDIAEYRKINRVNELSFTEDRFPKPVFQQSDPPLHCAGCQAVLT